jgi:hypothetical protein
MAFWMNNLVFSPFLPALAYVFTKMCLNLKNVRAFLNN